MNKTPTPSAVDIAEAHIERSLHPGSCECIECTMAFLMVRCATLTALLIEASAQLNNACEWENGEGYCVEMIQCKGHELLTRIDKLLQ